VIDFFELREATTGRDGVKCSAEKSQFGGYTALCKRGSKLVYSSQASYKDAATAKKHAEVYADAYYSQGERAADRAVRAFQQKNASKKYVKEGVTERRKDSAQDTYFSTYSAAVQYAKAQAEKQGYEVEEDDWFQQVTTGKGKPGRGKTTRHTLKLMKNGKPTRKGLAIQVYNRDTDKNTYELNYYVS
jgi:hypothetical protein